MRTRIVALALAVATLASIGTSRSDAQVRIGIQFNVPPPPRYEIAVEAPFRDAVWVRGCWSWDDYVGRYVWISGHWVAQPVYREVRFRHVPNGVAKGWWKKHGGSGRRVLIEHDDDD